MARIRLKTWLVAALGLGSLVVLIALSMQLSSRKAEQIYVQMEQLDGHHRLVESQLRRLRSDVNLSGIFVRDYLLDTASERGDEYRARIQQYRRANIDTLAELGALLGGRDETLRLRAMLDDYWQTFEPMFDWTPTQKVARSVSFLRKEVVPRREAALAMALEIEELNNTNLAAQRLEVARQHDAFRGDLSRTMWRMVLLGLAVAAVVVVRLWVLERRSEVAEHRMRELSQQLVSAQEEERKHLSRELHDHVAQVLTGLRLELGRIDRMSAAAAPAVAESRKLVDELFSTVRDLSLGLRPSMLDDFGLQAALEWHVRDFMARSRIAVDLTVRGDLDLLPEKHRTCVYRIVQEALTNCARHAKATRVIVDVVADHGRLQVQVHDDGVGIDPARRSRGLGLIGIDERVKELQGTMDIGRAPARGTILTVALPFPVMKEAALARAAS